MLAVMVISGNGEVNQGVECCGEEISLSQWRVKINNEVEKAL